MRALTLLLVVWPLMHAAGSEGIGVFDGHGDVGAPGRAGAATFSDGVYTVAGAGENMWFDKDAFHFVYTKIDGGDVTVSANIEWVGKGNHEHRKACLLVRQDLNADSAYADAALHGDGLTSLQCRATRGEATHEIQSNIAGPTRLRIERRGKYVSMSIAADGEAFKPAGGVMRLDLEGPFYVGLGVCSHGDAQLETAKFSNVAIQPSVDLAESELELHSTLETIDIASTDRRVVYHSPGHFEAPNWTPDGKSFVFNREGRLYRLPVGGGEPSLINTGFARRCNNDHGLSPDGSQIVISDQSDGDGQSRIYVLPASGVAEGEEPRRVTENAPSYWHGWSPDGKTLAYCARRNGEYDIYTIPTAEGPAVEGPVEGGLEKRLTDTPGLDDGPDYSPDGRYLYFNSIRSGTMHVWRIDASDGGNPTQLTHDDRQNWFPHPSPDGKWIVYLSYEPHVKEHPANQDVELRIIPAGGGEPRVLTTLFGGQGTINVPSWSPDSQRVAFVSYQFAPAE